MRLTAARFSAGCLTFIQSTAEQYCKRWQHSSPAILRPDAGVMRTTRTTRALPGFRHRCGRGAGAPDYEVLSQVIAGRKARVTEDLLIGVWAATDRR